MTTESASQRTFGAVIARRLARALQRAVQDMPPTDFARTGARDVFFEPVDALEASVTARGDRFISFGHYDYVGLSRHPDVIEAGVAALRRFGNGAGGSRLVGGERLAHGDFEKALARFLGVGGTLTMISGYLTNLTLIPHLLTAQDLLVIDDLAHNSISSTARTGAYACRAFEHNDLDSLERILEAERGHYRNVLIVSEGLFSMDGDIPDLPRLVEIKQRFNAWLMLDEAHSYGVLGKTGRGVTEHFGLDPRCIDISVGTLSKSFGASGGFIAAAEHVIEWLRYTLPGFVFSVGLSPVTVATAHAALEVLIAEPERLERLRANSEYFLRRASDMGLDTGPAIGMGVVPVLFDGTVETMVMARRLRDAGIYAPPVVQVGVPVDKPRVRFFLSANHQHDEIDAAMAVLAGGS